MAVLCAASHSQQRRSTSSATGKRSLTKSTPNPANSAHSSLEFSTAGCRLIKKNLAHGEPGRQNRDNKYLCVSSPKRLAPQV